MGNAALIIFGVTGDLARKKLLPSLYALQTKGKLPPHLQIIGVGRRALSLQEWDRLLESAIPANARGPHFASFKQQTSYQSVIYEDSRSWKSLHEYLSGNGIINRLFYLALPADVFGQVARQMKAAGLLRGQGWKRVVFEKPFGSDLESARKLNRQISSVFSEEEIYRIDHYLAKEFVQNILFFRFANPLFEQIWSNENIDHVQITIAEQNGVGSRAEYYEKAGAVRDMLQNHLLQILAFVSMEAPPSVSDMLAQKIRILKSIGLVQPAEIVIGQYGPGVLNGQKVAGYKQEAHVAPNSSVETYVAAKFHLNNKRWEDVPFYVRTGKRLAKSYAEINIVIKDVVCTLFCDERKEHPNIITIRIQPDEGVSLRFNVKAHGQVQVSPINPVLMDFKHKAALGMNLPEAYETLLLGVLQGDKTLFTSWPETELSWKVIDPLLKQIAGTKKQFPNYPAGSQGPKEADELLERDGHRWIG